MGKTFRETARFVSAFAALVTSVFVADLATGPAIAQSIPPHAQPGIAERELTDPPRPKSSRDIAIPKAAAERVPDGAENVSFVLRSISISGSSVYSDDDLLEVFEPLIDQEINLAAIFAVANKITEKYSNDGYALSIAFVPVQDIKNGAVRIQIAEGFVSEVIIQGEGRLPRKLLAKITDNIKVSRPLRTATLERYLMLARDLPGLSVRSVFDPIPGETGATRLVLSVSQDHFGGVLAVNDRGSKALGRERAALAVGFNSPFGHGGKIVLNTFQMFERQELTVYGLGFSMPVGSEGTVVGMDVFKSEAEPGTEFLTTLEFSSEGWTHVAYVAHPLVRSRSRNLIGSAQLISQDLSSEILGMENSDDQLRVLQLGIDYDWIDRWGGISLVGATLSRGLDIFGTTPEDSPTKSRADGKFLFTSIATRLYRLQDLAGPFDLALSADGQYAFDPLLSSQQCGYGGAQYGRGFDGYQISGDHCLKLGAELRWHLDASEGAFDAFQFYSFVDAGMVWRRGEVLPGEYREEEATSAGVGVRASLASRISTSVEYSVPFDEIVSLEGNREGRLFLSIGLSF